jgi:hypothetical protein
VFHRTLSCFARLKGTSDRVPRQTAGYAGWCVDARSAGRRVGSLLEGALACCYSASDSTRCCNDENSTSQGVDRDRLSGWHIADSLLRWHTAGPLLARRGWTGRRADAPLTPWSAGRSPSWQLGIAGQAFRRRRACLPAA